MLQAALEYLSECSDANVKEILAASIRLHLLAHIREELWWYSVDGTVSHEAISNLNDEFDQAVKDYVPYVNTVLEGLGLPENDNSYGTIARDYVAYTSQADADNIESAGTRFDFRKTGAPKPRL